MIFGSVTLPKSLINNIRVKTIRFDAVPAHPEQRRNRFPAKAALPHLNRITSRIVGQSDKAPTLPDKRFMQISDIPMPLVLNAEPAR